MRSEIYQALNSRANFSPSRTTVVLKVGTGNDEKTYQVDANALRALSGYFRTYFSGSRELLAFPDDDPLVFEMFLEWSKRPKRPIHYHPGQYSEEPWISNAVPAWMLAHRLGVPRFEMYALSQFIQNCAIAIKGPWKFIEDNVPSTSSLFRFGAHWVAWNTSLSGIGANEYTGLRAAVNAAQVNNSTRDPRIYDLDHWYSDCGYKINPKCEHDPVSQEQEQRAKSFRDRPPPPEWGFEAEDQASVRATY